MPFYCSILCPSRRLQRYLY